MTEPPDYEALNIKFIRDSLNNAINYYTFKTSNCDPNRDYFIDNNIDSPGYSSAKTTYDRYCSAETGETHFNYDRQQLLEQQQQEQLQRLRQEQQILPDDNYNITNNRNILPRNWRNNTPIQGQTEHPDPQSSDSENNENTNEFGNFVGYHRYGGVVRPVFKRGNKRFYDNGRKVRKGTRINRSYFGFSQT
jgi:hypothetical protein